MGLMADKQYYDFDKINRELDAKRKQDYLKAKAKVESTAVGKLDKWVKNKFDAVQKGHVNFPYNSNSSGRDRELDQIDRVGKCILENTCTLDYAICSGGVGPLSAGAVVNLHDGSVYLTQGISGTAIPNDIAAMLNKKNLTSLQFAKGIYKSITAKGGGCSFGYITNKTKEDREDIARFVNNWLPGKGVTTTVGFRGVTGGVTIPEAEKWFSPTAKVGIEFGAGTTTFDMSETNTKNANFKLEFLNKDKKK